MKAEEFKQKVIPLHRKLFPFALRMVQNREEAEDVVQEIFVKLWNMRGELESVRNIEAFAMTVTRNSCIDWLKKKKTLSYDDGSLFRQGISESDPLKETELKDALELVHRIIDELPEQQRSIIQLRDIEGYSSNEITEILEISHNTLRVNLSRARQKIREKLVNQYNYGQEENRDAITKIL